MRSRQRKSAARQAAINRWLSRQPANTRFRSSAATAEQLAFRDYIQQGYSAFEARAMIAADKL